MLTQKGWLGIILDMFVHRIENFIKNTKIKFKNWKDGYGFVHTDIVWNLSQHLRQYTVKKIKLYRRECGRKDHGILYGIYPAVPKLMGWNKKTAKAKVVDVDKDMNIKFMSGETFAEILDVIIEGYDPEYVWKVEIPNDIRLENMKRAEKLYEIYKDSLWW